MTAPPYYPQTKRWSAGLALMLILVAHLALFWLGLARTRPDKSASNDHALLVWMLPSPKPQPKAEPRPKPEPVPIKAISTRSTPNTRQRQAEAPTIRSIPKVATPPSLEALPNSVTSIQKPEVALPNTTGLVHTDLAKISKELEKDGAPNRLPHKYGAAESKLAQGIAQAGRGSNAAVSTTEITMPDGRIMTKVSGPWGSYCAFRDPVNGAGGLDPIQGGLPTLARTCPK